MLQYPHILGSKFAPIGKPCIAFYKYDGSNLRWEWSPKKGWNKFGTRTHLFDSTTETYNQAIPLFMNCLGDEIITRVKQINKKIERITAFTEFFGANSFCGKHLEGEAKELRLFDVFLFKKGFIPPKNFVSLFGDLPTSAQVIYEGDLTLEFIKKVRDGEFGLNEGVICKGDDFSVKVKTTAYLQKLHEMYGRDWINYAE